jgi:hypothetical protein
LKSLNPLVIFLIFKLNVVENPEDKFVGDDDAPSVEKTKEEDNKDVIEVNTNEDNEDVIEVDPSEFLEVHYNSGQCLNSDLCPCDLCVFDSFNVERKLRQEIAECFERDQSLRRDIEVNADRCKDLLMRLRALREQSEEQ